MIKDLSAKLVAAAAEINQKSRAKFVEEQNALHEKMATKQMKMPTGSAPEADPPAVSNAHKMAKTNNGDKSVKEEAEGSIPKTPREKELAAMHGHKKRITFGDVMKARGVGMKKEEVVDEGMLNQLRDRGNVATGQKQQDRKNFDTNTGAALKPNSTISGIRAKMQNKVQEEAELIDELSKSTLGSYVKKAAADSIISRKIAGDFENRANTKRSPTMKAAAISLSDKFKSDARKRKANVDKAVDRLTKEEAEQTQEGWDDMMKSVNATKGTGKFDKKEVKPGVTQYTRKSSTFDDGTGKDSDERRQDRERRKAVKEENNLNEAQQIHFTTGAASWQDLHKKVYAIHKSLRQEHPEKVSKHFGGSGSTGYVNVKNKSHVETVKAHIEKSGGKIVDHGHDDHIKAFKEENMDTPGNSTHQCAIHVKSEQFGEGRTLTSQHAEPDAQGNIAWYDVMFAEGIHRVETKDIEVLVSEAHMMHKKKKKAM